MNFSRKSQKKKVIQVRKIALWLIAALLIGGGIAMLALREAGPGLIDRLQGENFAPLAGSQRIELDETRIVGASGEDLPDGLTIETVFESVEVTREARDDIEIRLTGTYTAPLDTEMPKIRIHELDSGRVEIDIDRGLTLPHSFKSTNLRLMVKIPETLSGDLELQSVSGAVKLRSPGSAPFAGNVTAGSVSGRVYVEGLDARAVDLYSTSGTAEFIGSADQLDVKTVSGEILLNLTALRGDGYISSTSGVIGMTTEQSLNHEIKIKTTSGELELERPEANVKISEDRRIEATAGSGQFTLELSTVSGDVSVK